MSEPQIARPRRAFLQYSGTLATAAATTTWAGRGWPSESSKTIRMAVVGGGFGAGFWWHEHPRCRVTAVTDLYPERRKKLQDRYRCNAVYDSLETMIDQASDVDAVAVFSGAPDHARHVEMCMERGWHVVSACPACLTLEEAARLVEVKEKTGLRYMMAESSWYRQECILARNLFSQGAFGELFYSELEYYHQLYPLDKPLTPENAPLAFLPDGKQSWRWGLPPMLYPTHSLAFLTSVTGERIRKVSCLGWRGSRPVTQDNPMIVDNRYRNPFWSEASLMLTDRGHMTRCNVFWVAVASGERAQWFGDELTLYMPVEGLHDAAENRRPGGMKTIDVPAYWQSDMLPEPMRHASGHGGSAVFLSAEFINALIEDREPAVDLYESLAVTVPGIVAHQSAYQDGEQLDVPSFDRPGARRA